MALVIILKSSGLSNLTLTSDPYAIRQNTLDLGTEELLNSIPPSADTSVTLYERGVRAEARRTISMNAIVTGTSLANLDVQLNALRLRITNADSMTIQADGASAATTFNLEVGSSRCETTYSEEMRNALQTEVVLSLVTPPGDCWGQQSSSQSPSAYVKSFTDTNGQHYFTTTIQGNISTPINYISLTNATNGAGDSWFSVGYFPYQGPTATVADFGGTTDTTCSANERSQVNCGSTATYLHTNPVAGSALANTTRAGRWRLLLRANDAKPSGSANLKTRVVLYLSSDRTNAIATSTWSASPPERAQWHILDLGSWLLPPAPTEKVGAPSRWWLDIQGKRATTSAQAQIDCLYFLPEDRGGLAYGDATTNSTNAQLYLTPSYLSDDWVPGNAGKWANAPLGGPLIVQPKGTTGAATFVYCVSKDRETGRHLKWTSTSPGLALNYTPRYLELSS